MLDYNYEGVFCKRLAELRMQKGISAREMSLSLGLSDSYINKIENGKTLPSMEAFFDICNYLEVSPKDFFDDGCALPILIQAAVHEMHSLNEEQLKRIISIMQDINHSNR